MSEIRWWNEYLGPKWKWVAVSYEWPSYARIGSYLVNPDGSRTIPDGMFPWNLEAR